MLLDTSLLRYYPTKTIILRYYALNILFSKILCYYYATKILCYSNTMLLR